MQKLLFFLLFTVSILPLSARDNPRWLRYCAISPDGAAIAFAYKGKIYTVPTGGGVAKLLTKDSSYDFMPVWSHDGKWIAFAGNRYGNFDIFIIPATGGEPKRLTSHSADEYPYDFTRDDSSVLFGAVRLDAPACRQYPSDALQELYKVSSRGGRVEQVLTTPAEDAHVSPSGRLMVYHDRKGRENPWRKHQTSSIARDIWSYDPATGVHKKITSFNGEDRDPVFASDTSIYYLSEAGGSSNVYQLGLRDPSQPRQVTFFSKEPVRFLSISRDGTICFGYDGEIWCRRRNGDPFRVRVIVRHQPDEKAVVTVPVGDVEEMAVAPNGKGIAFIFHGEVFVCSTEGRSVRQITRTPGVEAGLSFSSDGRRLLYAGERDGRWKIFQTEVDTSGPVKESVLIGNEHENYQPRFSPDGREIAYIEDRTTLKIYNIASGVSRTILKGRLYSRRDNDQYFRWSPDGKWLLIGFSEPGAGNDETGIVPTDGKGRLINLTNSGFNDSQPRWAMGGKAIVWLSDRSGLRSYAGSGTRQKDVYALILTPEGWDDLRRIDSTIKGTTIRIDGPWEARRVRLTSRSMLLSDALLSADGSSLYYLARSDKGYDLWQMDLRSHESRLLAPLAAGDAFMDGDYAGRDIFICADGHIVAVDPATAQCRTVYTSGKLTLLPAAERQNMFEHVWRRVYETFYAAGLHGVDWTGYKTTYEKYLPDIDNNYDFAEMLNELLGELNVSHTGMTYRPSGKGRDVTASLGAFYDQSYRGTGLRIMEVMQDGPLDDPLLGIVPGVIIETIDGEPICSDRDFAGYLNHKAGKNTGLTIRSGGNTKKIMVRPVTPEEESELLYQRWVNRNRAETDSLSHGQLGYVHLPRMNDAAYRNVYEEVLGRYAGRKGIVVDTRFNRGGDLAPELTMFLGGGRIRDNVAGPLLVSSEPSFRWTQPSIVLAGEANYSDGSCFVYDYGYLHMGKIVGMPIPGSCTFQTGQSLQDNTLQWSCPTLGVKDLQGNYLEGRQTEPDVRVMNEFDKVAAGRDQQLETAIQVLLKDLR